MLPLHATQSWAFKPPSAAITMHLRVMPALQGQVLTLFTEYDDSGTWTSTVCGKEGWSHIFVSLGACQPTHATVLAILISQYDSDCSIMTCLWCLRSFLDLALTLQHGHGRASPHKLGHLHLAVSGIAPIKPDTNFSVFLAECPLTSRGLGVCPETDENAVIFTGWNLTYYS